MTMPRIRQLLETRLKTWADNRSQALRVAWQSVGFTPTNNETYLRAFLLPAPTVGGDLSGAHRAYTGVFQVSVIAPKGVGVGAAEGIAEEIATLFPDSLRLTIPSPAFALTMTSPMSAGQPLVEPDYFVIPVSAQYRADTV
jgi:hypothetical protein